MSEISRREFARLAGVGGVGALGVVGLVAVRHRPGRGQGGDRRRRRRRGDGGALRQEGRAGARRHADRGQPDLQLLVLLQPLSSAASARSSRSITATAACGSSASRWCTTTPPTSTRAKKTVKTRGGRTYPYDRLVLSPGIDIKYDSIKGYSREASRIMPHAYTTAAAGKRLLKRQLRGHARRRHGGDGDAQQSLPLPARPLRARLHDRALPQDQEAEVEARHPRSQEGVLQAAGVHRGVREVLQGHHRAEPDHRDRRLRGRQRRSPRPRRSSPRPARR